jgi:hypothetical protein
MVCTSCVTVKVKYRLENAGAQVEEISLGQATILKPDEPGTGKYRRHLNKRITWVLVIKKDEKLVVVEEVKLAVLELVQRQL